MDINKIKQSFILSETEKQQARIELIREGIDIVKEAVKHGFPIEKARAILGKYQNELD